MPLTFGEKIKEARKSQNLTQKQLADSIGAKHNSVSDWENDKNKPDPDTIELLCGILKITPNYLLQSSKEDFSPKEKQLISKYRALDPHGKEMVDFTLLKEWERSTAKSELESNPSSSTAKTIPIRFLSYYQRMASAGSGAFLFPDIPTDVIAVPDTPLSRKADFVIGVNGRSMENTFFDGDKVLVEKTNEVPIGEIGIFIRDGEEFFIKEVGQDRLISHNKDCPDIIPDKRRIDTIGIVLGKVGE